MPTPRLRARATLQGFGALLVCSLALTSLAARGDGGDIQRFQPSATASSGFATAGGDLLAPGDVRVGLTLDYSHNPLVLRIDGARAYAPVQNNLTANATAAFGIGARFELDLAAPLILDQHGTGPQSPALPAHSLGDLWIRPVIQLLSQAQSGVSLSLSPTLVIPLLHKLDFASESSTRLFPEAGISYRGTTWFGAAGVMFKWRGPDTSPAAGVTLGNELGLDLALGRILSPEWELIGELLGGVALATVSEGVQGNPLEGILGARYRLGDSWTLQLAAGGGIFSAPGTPDARVIASVVFGNPRPHPGETCILHDPAGAQVVSKRGTDRDHDGIDDACDLCPYVAGDAPTGCPAPLPPPACPPAPAPVVAPPTPPAPRIVPPTPTAPAIKRQVIIKRIEFEFDSDVIRHESLPLIEDIVAELNKMPAVRCRVEGHTDQRGRRKYNIELSSRRAAAVMREMIRMGIDPRRLSSKGLGFTRPLAPNDSEEHRKLNRRVEFVLEMPDGDPRPAAPPP